MDIAKFFERRKARRAALKHAADLGLERIHNRLGLGSHSPEQLQHNTSACRVSDTAEHARSIFYAPDMDGHVDPGEVVWFWAPSDISPKHLEERCLVVIGRHGDVIMGLLTSPNPDHETDEHWMDIGAGPWDDAGRQSWVRLDKTITIPEDAIRRQGAVLPQHRFERIANRLRKEFGWG